MAILYVGLGGFLGASLRYVCSTLIEKSYLGQFPLSTFLINIVGCFLLGLFVNSQWNSGEDMVVYNFLVVGVLGGFTTFSTFGLESISLIQMGHTLLACSYIIGSVVAGCCGLWVAQLLLK